MWCHTAVMGTCWIMLDPFCTCAFCPRKTQEKYDFICLGANAGSTLPFFSMRKKVSATCIDKVHVHSKPWIFTWGAHGNVRTWRLDDMPGLGVSLSFLLFLSFCQGTSQPSRAVGAWTSPKQRERFSSSSIGKCSA